MFATLFGLLMLVTSPFGTWKSPITTDLMGSHSTAFYDMQTDGHDLYWTELRPKEKARLALMKNGASLFDDISVKTRVHEYGGGAFSVKEGGLIFSNDADKQLYRYKQGNLEKLTDTPTARYADGNRSYWVCEKHEKTVENCIVHVSANGVKEVATGHDFYSNPRVSPDGKQLAFITWDFPNMQWDSSYLWLADIQEEGTLSNLRVIAGGSEESICQVQWSPEGTLYFVSDHTGFWNLYSFDGEKSENLCPMDAEFGMPGWVFGRPTYAFLRDGRIVCMYAIKGVDALGILDPAKKTLEKLNLPFTLVQNLVTLEDKVYFFGASSTLPISIISYDPDSNEVEIIKQSFDVPISKEWISQGEIIEYPSLDGKTGYAFYYPPTNPNYQAPEGEKPPMLVKSHGGPTSRSYNFLCMEIQYWTSRGFAFLDVNYGGSTGYGREYFKRLEKKWGILDVEDCVSASRTVAKMGLADEKRLVVRGGSAGGYTTMACLTFRDLFAGGTSYYGVSDLELLYQDTHKFEAQYTDILIGKYPEELPLIQERSPSTYPEKIHAPLLLLQGTEDKIVPPNQAQRIFEVLKKKGTPVGMLLFEGEGHGFRQASNIKWALDAELYFYAKILGLKLPDPFEKAPVKIHNLNDAD